MKKKWIIVPCLYLLPLIVFSQHPDIQQFYNKYAGYENVMDINIHGWLLKLTGEFADDAGSKEALRKISYLRVLLMEKGNLVQKTDVKTLTKQLRSDAFDELVTVKDKGNNIRFFIKEAGKTITDVLLMVDGTDGFVLLSLEGAFSLEDLQHLNIDVEGGEYLKKIPRNRA